MDWYVFQQFYKGDKFSDFLIAFMHTKPLGLSQKKKKEFAPLDILKKERICFPWYTEKKKKKIAPLNILKKERIHSPSVYLKRKEFPPLCLL